MMHAFYVLQLSNSEKINITLSTVKLCLAGGICLLVSQSEDSIETVERVCTTQCYCAAWCLYVLCTGLSTPMYKSKSVNSGYTRNEGCIVVQSILTNANSSVLKSTKPVQSGFVNPLRRYRIQLKYSNRIVCSD